MRSTHLPTILLFIFTLMACHKQSSTEPETVITGITNGMGDLHNWHVTHSYSAYATSGPDSGKIVMMTDSFNSSFALTIISGDSVQFKGDKYYYDHTDNNTAYFRIWHFKFSNNTSNITYNTLSKATNIYTDALSSHFTDRYWYYNY